MGDHRTILATALGWAFPGLGHLYLGRRGKAALFAATVLGLYLAGVLLAGGHAVSWSREPLWYVGEAGALLPTVVAGGVASALPREHVPDTYHVGLLYATVAGLLNVVVAMDAFGIALARARGARA